MPLSPTTPTASHPATVRAAAERSTTSHRITTSSGDTTTRHHITRRVATSAAAVTALLAILFTVLALPAQAATNTTNTGSGIGTQQTHHPVASPTDPAGALTVGALSLAGIVATAAGVLWYTARTRRTVDSDHS
jgi:hypothetical protein